MTREVVLLDAGPLVAALNRRERTHDWVARQFEQLPPPFLTCEAVLIRMSELHEPCAVLTLDSDFHVYRRHGRRTIPLIRPASESR